jgi:regulatory protein
MEGIRKHVSKEEAIQKLKHYCAYQERCHSEVKEKLFSLGIWKKDQDEVIASLIQEGYLNEERFAIAFAGGKWRIKRWGKGKIKYELKQRGVSDYCIRKAMKEIDDADYKASLQKLAKKKYDSLKGLQPALRKRKTISYMVGRGFEAELVNQAIGS